MRYEPAIAPQVVSSAPSLLAAPRSNPPLSLRHQLLSDTVALCSTLPDLCSPAGGVAILPTVLFLTTGVLREVGHKVSCLSSENKSPPDTVSQCSVDTEDTFHSNSIAIKEEALLECPPLTASYKSIGTLCSHPYAKDTRSADQWCSLLQSALTTVIDSAKTC